MLQIGFASPATARSQASATASLASAATGRHQHVRRDEVLFWEGEAVDGCYRVISGAVRLCKLLPDGRRQISDFFGPGDLILIELSHDHEFTAEAISNSVICHYSRATLEALLQCDLGFSRQLLTVACDRLVSAHHRMTALGRKTAEERLASFLAASARRLPETRRVMNLPMTRTDIADYLGLTIETVSRTLSKFKRDGLIDLPDSHSVVVCKLDALERLSEGEA